MATKINGNQIQAATRGLVEAWSVSEQLNLPPLNQSQINALGTPAYGTLVYNTTEDQAQIYLQDANAGNPGWDDVGGGGPSVGENSIIRTNGTTISENITVGPTFNGGVEFTNGFTAGPIEIANGFTVTVENNATWMIMGQDDLSYAQFVDIESGHGTFTGTLAHSGIREHLYYYQTSGTVNHDWNAFGNIWVRKTGGGNYTINLTNAPTYDSGSVVMVVYTRFDGGTGTPTGWTVNGQTANVYFGPHGSGAGGLVQRAVCYIQNNGAFPGGKPSVLINIENFS
tara:strand:- start:8466 stop:9317 length:852 start_codon:yes stop_codon:yes gene_type:complete